VILYLCRYATCLLHGEFVCPVHSLTLAFVNGSLMIRWFPPGKLSGGQKQRVRYDFIQFTWNAMIMCCEY
jgi:hypothetical protein